MRTAWWLVVAVVLACATACSKDRPAYKSNVATLKIENRAITTSDGKPYSGPVIARDKEILAVATGVLPPAMVESIDGADTTGLVLVMKAENGQANGRAELLVDLNAPKLNSEVARRSGTALEIARAASPTIKVADATFEAGKLDGVVTFYEPNEQGDPRKTAEAHIANDTLEGKATEFHANGKVAREATYAAGKLHGEVTALYANGAKRSHGKFEHDQPIGKHERWFPNGKTERVVEYGGGDVRTVEYYSNGREKTEPPDGVIEEFYPSGTVRSRTTYIAGVKHGREQTWWKNGKPAVDATYEQGALTGDYKRWYANGKDWESARYVSGKLDGPYRKWWKNGKAAHVYAYKDGKLDGDYRTFYDNGAKWAVGSYALGKPQGALQKWFPDGKLGYVMNHENGRPHGPYKRWWPSGKPRLEASHVSGMLDGAYKNWNEDGTIFEDASYARGMKVTDPK